MYRYLQSNEKKKKKDVNDNMLLRTNYWIYYNENDRYLKLCLEIT